MNVFQNLLSPVSTMPFIKGVMLFYLFMLFNQAIYLIYRPKDKDRLLFTIFFLFYIVYNILTGYLPDHRALINFDLQVKIISSFPLLMAYYMVFYIYKVLDIKKLSKLLIIVPIFTLLAPYVLLFLIPYSVTEDKVMAIKIISFVPGVYAVISLYLMNTIIKKEYVVQSMTKNHFNLKIASANLGILANICLVIAQLINNNDIGVILVNGSFIIMSCIFLYILIVDNQNDYNKLQTIENELKGYSERLESKVVQRTKELELSNRQREDTLMKIAHETRTPLTLIKNDIEEYIQKNRQSKEIKNIKKNIDSLNEKITSILEIDHADILHEKEQVIDFSGYVKDKTRGFVPIALKKDISIKEIIEKGVKIKAPVHAIESILNNLIENAIKYTRKGGAIIVKMNSKGNEVIFSVKDNGYGIAGEYKDKIFEPYFQIPVPVREKQGIGIGLSIVKNLVTEMGGKIELISKVDIGSEFIVKLKKYNGTGQVSLNKPGNEGTKKQNEKIEDSVTLAPLPSILIIEDNVELLLYMRDKLKEDYNIYVATDGKKALKKLPAISEKTDLIISDIMMEEMDGIKFYQTLKEMKFGHIPIVYITANSNPVDKNKALQMGAMDYICKPFEISEVKAKISSIIKNSIYQREVAFSSIQNMIDRQKTGMLQDDTNENMGFEEMCVYYNISQREKEILHLIKMGKTYKEIADRMFISKKTVDAHLSKIRTKVGVGNKQELLNIFYKSK